MGKKLKKNDPELIRRRKQELVSMFSIALVVMIVFSLMDLVKLIKTESSAYELRYESDEDYKQAGKVYTLYVDGKFSGYVDQNEYCMLDENGNTDYKYCTLMDYASRFTYMLILSAMLYLVLIIAKNTLDNSPFNRENIKIVKAISIMQLLLGILPGMVRTIMSFIRFDYSSTVLDEKWLYMVIIAFVIGTIAVVFEKGLVLKEDMDSIA